MSEILEIRFSCKPGSATPELALACHAAVAELLDALADDIEPGAVRFGLRSMEWIDDGNDEIVIRVTA